MKRKRKVGGWTLKGITLASMDRKAIIATVAAVDKLSEFMLTAEQLLADLREERQWRSKAAQRANASRRPEPTGETDSSPSITV